MSKQFHRRVPKYKKISPKRTRFKNDFERDIAAMRKVWKMLIQGANNWLGDIGRKY